ncbi:sensor histidine kinase [Cerasicoccus maritimus]|uniref:sensor histidine kinase n=1 Tax=Cerasicoccus maritimus TaxID=490089 RepID=UPI0028526453|nr:hybrid sensor histidine kinase/response regulator [Cerasicoccus maritimus]
MDSNSPATLLVVDDNPTNLAVVCAHLTKCGYRMLTAENAKSALRRLERIQPDLMLLDVMMPDMDGFQLAAQIREREDYHGQPMIFMTALDDMESKLKGFAAGGVDYITKPIQHEELLVRIKTHLEVHQLRQELSLENQRKDELIQELEAYDMTVAHDLKNPIGGIASAAETFDLMDDLTDTEAREIVEMIKLGANQCQHIINGLLSFARLRKGHATLQVVDMEKLARQSIDALKTMIQEVNASITIEGALPLAYGYAPWLTEVWANLISNAIKYGGCPPKIVITGSIMGQKVCYKVCDNGTGLPADQDSMFKPFARNASAYIEGTGLGLSIVERILRRLDGAIIAENNPEGGANLTFYLPSANHAQ